MDFTFIDLFAGIGGIRIPFDEQGGRCVFSSEWDNFAQDMYEANFGERPHGDICNISTDQIPHHDILLAGFPCQPFSIMGSKLGFADTRGTMFFEIERILAAKQPKAILLENVKQLESHDGGRTIAVILDRLRSLGYKTQTKILNALSFGVPQKRERIIIVGFLDHTVKFDIPEFSHDYRITLDDILQPDTEVDSKYFASDEIVRSRIEKIRNKVCPEPSVWHQNKSGNIGIHQYSCALRAGASYNYLLVNGIRRFTPRELLRLQGFPEDFKIVVSDQQIRKQTGNSVAVPMIRAVARELVHTLQIHELVSAQEQLQEMVG